MFPKPIDGKWGTRKGMNLKLSHFYQLHALFRLLALYFRSFIPFEGKKKSWRSSEKCNLLHIISQESRIELKVIFTFQPESKGIIFIPGWDLLLQASLIFCPLFFYMPTLVLSALIIYIFMSLYSYS